MNLILRVAGNFNILTDNFNTISFERQEVKKFHFIKKPKDLLSEFSLSFSAGNQRYHQFWNGTRSKLNGNDYT
jgi:hypothetical protein